MNKKLWVALILLVAASLACTNTGLGGNLPQASSTPVATSTLVPQSTVIVTVVGTPAPLNTSSAEVTLAAIQTGEALTAMAPTATPVIVTKVVTQVVVQSATPQNTADAGKTAASDATSTSVPATSTLVPTTQVSTTNAVSDTTPVFVQDLSHGQWTISGTERLADNPTVITWTKRLLDPDPAHWRVFPNIANPDLASFDVRAGAEYGVPNVPFCYTPTCDWIMPAWHYVYYSGPYQFLWLKSTDDGSGNILITVNVMDSSATIRNQKFDNGFREAGRYWDGNRLDQAIEGLVSNGSANMLGMPTLSHPGEVLNSGKGDNAGANCGVQEACAKVYVTVVVFAGDVVLEVLHVTVVKP